MSCRFSTTDKFRMQKYKKNIKPFYVLCFYFRGVWSVEWFCGMWSEECGVRYASSTSSFVYEYFISVLISLHTPHSTFHTIYIIRYTALWGYSLSIKNVKMTLFLKNNGEKFWRFARNVYLCIRFRAERRGSNSKKSSLIDLHRQK